MKEIIINTKEEYDKVQMIRSKNMFEKEAEEYYNGQYDAWLEGEDSFALEEEIEQAFKDGAEFGYNKANEWHYPSKGEYPKEDKICLLYLGDMFNPTTGWYKNGHWCFEDDRNENIWQDCVIAWKEIVLPELKESE